MSRPRAAWRTEAREAILCDGWPKGIRRDVLHAKMLAEEGPEFPAHYASVWARQLGLKRPAGFQAEIVEYARVFAVRACQLQAAERKAAKAARPKAPARPAKRKAVPAPPAEERETAPVAPLPPGTIRHTPALAAALDLVAHGLPPEAIRQRVKLTVVEYAKVREVAGARHDAARAAS